MATARRGEAKASIKVVIKGEVSGTNPRIGIDEETNLSNRMIKTANQGQEVSHR